MAKTFLRLAEIAVNLLPPKYRKIVYRLGPVTRFLRRILNKFSPVGLTQVKIAAGALKDCLFILDLQAEKDYWLGTYEFDLLTAIEKFTRPGMVIYDIGANVGYISIAFGKFIKGNGQVFAFEALPENISRLKKNISINRMDQLIFPRHAAVGSENEPVQFLVHQSDDMGKILGSAGRSESYFETITVPGITLNDFIYKQNNPIPDIIKLDIEGGEVLALPGMKQVLNRAKPILLVELHGKEAIKSSWQILAECNYSIRLLESGYPIIESVNQLNKKAYILAHSKQMEFENNM